MREQHLERDRGLSRGAVVSVVGERGQRQPPVVLVFSEQPLIAEGLVGLLPDGWQGGAVIVDDLTGFEGHAPGAVTATVIDAETPGAPRAGELTRALGGSVIVLVASAATPLAAPLHDDADAILIRDEVGPRTLRLGLVAGRLGMRLFPRALPVAAQVAVTPAPLGDSAAQALELLAAGMRDAEIAQELNLSESAVRKLIQRAVRRAGARTRCQAVAAAVRAGGLR